MKKIFKKIYLPLIFALILIVGILLGRIFSSQPSTNYGMVYASSDKLSKILYFIENRYVDTVDRSKLVESAIPGMLEELDPHSTYIPPAELEGITEELQGNFEGIGISFNKQNDTVVVITTISGGPSEKVGILPGDRFIKVNDSIIAGVEMPSDEIISMLKGERGTKVKVSVKRKGISDLINFEIIRDKIPIYSVDASYMIEPEIGYIKINRFARTTFKEFLTAVDKLKNQGMKKIIVDLRGNVGGYMIAATNIADQFLEGDKLIVYTEGKASPRNEIYSTSRRACKDLEVMVILDEFSASASEILAGAIQDNDRGLIVGRRSFGKGLVQDQFQMEDGSALRLTVARYYTPTGRSIQKPYEEGNDDYYNDLNRRFSHGEFAYSDSIQFADSLKYTTPEGNVVYGGGGIMPDIFIPLDTTGYSKYYAQVTTRGLVYRFAFQYADNNRQKLDQYDRADAINTYLDKQNLMSDFIDFAASRGVEYDKKGYEQSEHYLHTQLKAYIARNIIDNEGFYPILGEIDMTLQKAVRIFKKRK